MPWCDTCDRFYNPNSLLHDGTCPTCGRVVAASTACDAEVADVADVGAPWHFKVLLAVTAVYLGYRLFEGIVWVAQHL